MEFKGVKIFRDGTYFRTHIAKMNFFIIYMTETYILESISWGWIALRSYQRRRILFIIFMAETKCIRIHIREKNVFETNTFLQNIYGAGGLFSISTSRSLFFYFLFYFILLLLLLLFTLTLRRFYFVIRSPRHSTWVVAGLFRRIN